MSFENHVLPSSTGYSFYYQCKKSVPSLAFLVIRQALIHGIKYSISIIQCTCINELNKSKLRLHEWPIKCCEILLVSHTKQLKVREAVTIEFIV